jgi:enoyl-CoA hydratase/carnithine racemase
MNQDLSVRVSDRIATVEIRRPPNNYFDVVLIAAIADAYETLDDDPDCRVIVLAAEGKAFCAGADLSGQSASQPGASQSPAPQRHLYKEAIRLFRTRKPVVAAVHGAAVGGGLGLALSADFRVTCEEARFSANFSRLGFHPGFGLSVTLPRLVGPQHAATLLYTGRRIGGRDAVGIGLADRLVNELEVRKEAVAFATEIAHSAPLAILSIRETLRRGLADAVEAATERELVEQDWQRKTADFKEGVSAMAARRTPNFTGR